MKRSLSLEALMEQVAAAEMAVTQPSPWDMGPL